MADIVKVKRMEGEGSNAEPVEAVKFIWGILYAEDVGIVYSKAPERVEKMMPISVIRVVGLFELLVSEPPRV